MGRRRRRLGVQLGPQDDDDSIAAIRRAVEHGVNWVDTAPVYGLGHSEEVIGRAITGLRDRPYVFTKCGLVPDERGELRRQLSAASVTRELEASLRRLRVDAIDLYQIQSARRCAFGIVTCIPVRLE